MNKVDFYDIAGDIVKSLNSGGVLCVVTDKDNRDNVLTLSWGQLGRFYENHPVFTIAITPLRHSWNFIEQVPNFTIAVPGENLKDKVKICGTKSGRDIDKFKVCKFTKVKGIDVKTPHIAECKYNIECEIYHKITPPHKILTPAHRKAPIEQQHTIYFAKVMGAYQY